MMDDYLFDGLGPSPEALQAWDESRAAREAAEQERAPPTIEEQLEHEKARAAALEDELKAARGETEAWVRACVEIKILRRVLNHRVVLHAIDATPARWRDDAGSSPLDRARTAAPSPRKDLLKNCRVHRRTG